MINLKLIYKALGSLLFIEAFMMLLCLAMALFYGEDDVLGFTMAIILIVMTAFVLKFNGRASTNSMNRRDAYLLVTLTWIVFSLFGALPFVISGYIPSFTTDVLDFAADDGFLAIITLYVCLHTFYSPKL